MIREDANQPVQIEEAPKVLFEAIRDRAESLFLEDAAASAWLARYAFVKGAIPEMEWPEMGREAFEELIELICQGKSKLEDVRRADLVAYLESRLAPTLLSVLRKEAPAAITVPSGRQVKLTYEPGRPPVLAVRLQEVFGWTETPTLGLGKGSRPAPSTGPELPPGPDHVRPQELLDDNLSPGAKGSPRPVSQARLAGGSLHGPGDLGAETKARLNWVGLRTTPAEPAAPFRPRARRAGRARSPGRWPRGSWGTTRGRCCIA